MCACRLAYKHGAVPDTKHLLASHQIIDWINSYQPGGGSLETPKIDVTFDADSKHILWAADVWYSIKKHWVLELQQRLLWAADPQDRVHRHTCPSTEPWSSSLPLCIGPVWYIQARRIRRRIGRSPNVKPRGAQRKESFGPDGFWWSSCGSPYRSWPGLAPPGFGSRIYPLPLRSRGPFPRDRLDGGGLRRDALGLTLPAMGNTWRIGVNRTGDPGW